MSRRYQSAYPPAEAPCAAAFLQTSGVNTAAVLRDAQGALAAASRLQEYRGYLAQARAYKAARGDGAASGVAAIDREVLAHGRAALADVHTLSASALRVVGALRRGGGLDPLAASALNSVRGGLRVREAWEQALASEPARGALRRAGASEALVHAIGEGARALDAKVTAQGTRIRVEGTYGGRPATAAVETAPRPEQPRTVIDLLTRGRFEALADATARGGPAYLEGAFPAATEAHVDDLALLGALGTLREGVRHVRKLEDLGLAVYEGGEPGTIAVIAGIALAALIISAIIIIAECPDNGEGEPDIDAGGPACGIGVLLFLLALITFGVLADDASSTGSGGGNVALGTTLVHGVVRDLEAVRA